MLQHFDREESSLVDMFTLEILVIYLESLAMAHKDDKSLGKHCAFVKTGMHIMCSLYRVRWFQVLILNVLKLSLILRESSSQNHLF